MLKWHREGACEPCALTSVMSATPLGFAVSAHYDASAILTAHLYGCIERRDDDSDHADC